ncbi:AMP-binding protein [Rhodococcus sp. BP-349]|uniref:AMP-binding protein n=1 Tax=unclassified Rhodococcus (in: high G+C Gram-positive bacteria) TaxID=192944 RepID=UPI001C9AFBB7|nr:MULTISPECIES: AMP-binding protein [unclassified Rhodococcus (in: high G+C Gram-positive bacteria)]MBY6540965.1 AMP-binding protein [Rhodococcus sp. BP-363]MBY6545009.1 AMP-binding protein [Rhodococcus sp. BP-369]MBY6564239.1 AMP-binding protein [Rhodococcus sp. BP-370]MBY6578824.1 AMP-binding protein [Rhodococcus sp. BP-364]MBY6588125.1 AMP-binding protein [Rhodococcus sp. BP-358]
MTGLHSRGVLDAPPSSVPLESGVVAAIDAVARRKPSSLALVSSTESITYGELAVASRNRGAALRRVHDGDRVPLAVLADGSVDALISVLAVLASGHPLFAVDADLPDVLRAHASTVVGAVPAASVTFDARRDAVVHHEGVWWESPAWDQGMTEAGRPTALDAWRPALVALGPGATGRVTVTHEELTASVSDLAVRAGLTPGARFDLSHPSASVAGLVGLLAGLVTGCTVSATGRGFPAAV